jgi:hypothetical protein
MPQPQLTPSLNSDWAHSGPQKADETILLLHLSAIFV